MGFEVEAISGMGVNALGHPVINQSGVPDEVLFQSADVREIAQKLSRWVDNARSAGGKTSMFDRGSFTPPENPYDEMRAARLAVAYDDIVGGVAELTESFAFQGVKWEGDDADDADIFNQMSRDLDLDSVLRRLWRDVYTYSQVVVGMLWGWKEYTVRGKTGKGNARKKRYRIWCPIEIKTIDPTKVVPVGGTGPWGGDYLAWCSTLGETQHWTKVNSGDVIDPLMGMFFVQHYTPQLREEADELEGLGVDTSNLLLMNPTMVWRHTLTRPDYERFSEVRMKNVFPILDLKRQLTKSDRAMLIGTANYILLIRKGTKEQPGTPEEIGHLKENFNFIAKLPVIISDHRLDIDIIAPKTDFTLKQERYDLLDTRLLMRLMGTLSLGSRGQRNETALTLSRAVGRGMENRRHMMARDFERRVARAICDHPRNAGLFNSEPSMVYVPRNIGLDIDAEIIQGIMNLRARNEISRDTTLEYFGLDQKTEAQRMEFETEFYDDIFQTHIPFDSPMGDPSATGAQGGRPVGGGQPTQDATKVRGKTASGNTKKGDA